MASRNGTRSFLSNGAKKGKRFLFGLLNGKRSVARTFVCRVNSMRLVPAFSIVFVIWIWIALIRLDSRFKEQSSSKYSDSPLVKKPAILPFTVWSLHPSSIELFALDTWIATSDHAKTLILTLKESFCEEIQSNGRSDRVICSSIQSICEFGNNASCIWNEATSIAKSFEARYLVYFESNIAVESDEFKAVISFLFQDDKHAPYLITGHSISVRHSELEHIFKTKNSIRKNELLGTSGRDSHHVGYCIFPTEKQLDLPAARFLDWIWFIVSGNLVQKDIHLVDVSESLFTVRIFDPTNSLNSCEYGKSCDRTFRSPVSEIKLPDLSESKLKGNCVASCYLEKNKKRDLVSLSLFRNSNVNSDIAILTVNSGYLDLARNWICWSKRAGFVNFVLLSEDVESKEILTSEFDVDVLLMQDAPQMKISSEYGSVEFQDTMNYRTRFLLEVLEYGFNFLTADMDSIWLEDPFKYIAANNSDVQGQQHKLTELSGGLIYVKATSTGLKLWKKVVDCQEKNLKFLKSHAIGTYDSSKYTEQFCIQKFSKRLAASDLLKIRLLKSNRFPDGKAFFEDQLPLKQGVWPVIVHNNWILGVENKKHRFEDWNLWAVDSQNKCKQLQRISISDKATFSRLKFIVKILTFNRPASLLRLLESLERAIYPAEKQITLIISVDQDENMNSSNHLRENVLNVAKTFRFSHGQCRLENLHRHIGLVGQWINAWEPSDDNEILVVFEDDLTVSQHWFTWLNLAVSNYYADSTNFDSRLFGISLQSQKTIVGEDMYRKRGQSPASLLSPEIKYYKYQLLGTWGAVFFPRHWKEFQQWYHSLNPGFEPCVPTLYSNFWWKRKPKSVWSQWFIRFAFERGYYSLYTNFPNEMALVTNHREPGENFAGKKPPTNDLLENLTYSDLRFPLSRDILIYDFHFNKVDGNPDILAYRSNLYGDSVQTPLKSYTCYSFRKYSPSKEDLIRS